MNASPAVEDGARGEPGQLELDPIIWKDIGVKQGTISVSIDADILKLEWSPPVGGGPPETVERSVHYFANWEQVARKAPRRRLTGPVRFVLKLIEFWRLTSDQVVGLLGFDQSDSNHVAAALDGIEMLRGRDVRDRIAYLFAIRATLRSLFRDLDVENDWLREPHSLLDERSPLTLMSNGSVEDLLIVKEYVDTVAGR